jgi:TolB-like protein/Tfp pilus assembly protein PilF
MGADEVGTARTLREHRKVTGALVAKHGGRLVKTTGDGVLLEFPSVVDAVECAVAVQAAMAERNEGIPQDRRMLYRIGINLGDILIEGDDILGDGVNVAARLEGIAEPGGICLSSSAYEQVRGKVPVDFTNLGEQTLKNIARPVRCYAVGLSAGAHQTAPLPSSAPRLSIVVLPFANIGGDPKQDYFVDGVTESLTTDLSRISGAFVIARSTAFTFKGKAIEVRKLGRELNVRYALEASVQRSGKHLRINAQLIDAERGNHVWAERFDKPVADLFEMQDEIVSRLANTLKAKLIAVEAGRAEQSMHPDAMDLNFQGKACLYKGTTANNLIQARGFFERALAVDPQSVSALLGLARVDFRMASAYLADDRVAWFLAAEKRAIEALSLAPDHSSAHLILGGVYIYTNRAAQGIVECEEALRLNHNAAYGHGLIGMAKLYLGRAAETEAHILQALRLSPRDNQASGWMTAVGAAKIQLGADAEAAAWLRRSIEADRNFAFGHFSLAAALGLLGALDEARTALNAGLGLDPGFTIRRAVATRQSDNPIYLAGRERFCEGWRLAGVPEG